MTRTIHIEGSRLWELGKIGALGVALGVGWGTLSADVGGLERQMTALQRQVNILVDRDIAHPTRTITTAAPPRVGAAGTADPPPVFSSRAEFFGVGSGGQP